MRLVQLLYIVLSYFLLLPFLLVTMILCFLSRKKTCSENARLVWGPDPIINNKYWSAAMQEAGYNTRTYMYEYYGNINNKADYDEYVFARTRLLPERIKLIFLFWESLFRFDVFILPFRGWLLGRTPYWWLEAFFFKTAWKKTFVMPYGGDAYVYGKVRSMGLLHGLLLSYPQAARRQKEINARMQYWVRNADFMLTSRLGMDGFGRWDVMIPTNIYIDLDKWKPSSKRSDANGKNDTVYVAHAPNHTGFKGTEFIQNAISELQLEGLKVELILLQGVQNEIVKETFISKVDILAEQLIAPSFGMNGLEGMACGLPVICNVEEREYTDIFRRWSYFGECPVVSASPESFKQVLKLLIESPNLRHELGRASRCYCEKYHSYDACRHLFTNALRYVYKEISSKEMMNLYHPILGEYPKSRPRVEHPLINNKIDAA